MSYALAHFSAGATVAALVLLATKQYNRPGVPLYITLGGIWGMLPDVHWVVPHEGLSQAIYGFHGTRWADLFAGHYTMDITDPTHSLPRMAAFVGVFVCAMGVLSLAQYYSATPPQTRTPARSEAAPAATDTSRSDPEDTSTATGGQPPHRG